MLQVLPPKIIVSVAFMRSLQGTSRRFLRNVCPRAGERFCSKLEIQRPQNALTACAVTALTYPHPKGRAAGASCNQNLSPKRQDCLSDGKYLCQTSHKWKIKPTWPPGGKSAVSSHQSFFFFFFFKEPLFSPPTVKGSNFMPLYPTVVQHFKILWEWSSCNRED